MTMKKNSIGFGGTPVSNTGLYSQTTTITNKNGYEVGVDWLTISSDSISAFELSGIIELIEKTFDETIEFNTKMATFDGKHYSASSVASLRGTRVFANYPNERTIYAELRFKIPGKALSAATANECRDTMAVLKDMYGFTCSRFDCAIDDYGKVLDLDEVKKAQDLGNFAHVEVTGYHESGERGGKEKGKTITFGSRVSESYLRVYDKSVQSSGEIDAIRFEVEFKGAKAQAVFEQYCDFTFDDEQGAAKVIAGAALGAVRFCDRSSGEKNLERLTDLPWYKKLCDSVVSGFRLRVRKKERFLDDAIGWVTKAVMPTLAMIRSYMGDDVFLQWVYDETTEQMPLMSKIKREKIKQQQQLDLKEQQNRTTVARRRDMRELMFEDGLYWD
jgi:Replication initiation factor